MWKKKNIFFLVQSGTFKSGQDIIPGAVDIFVISQLKWQNENWENEEKITTFGRGISGVFAFWSPGTSFKKMFGHTKFQLSTSCTFKVMLIWVVHLLISTRSDYESTRDRVLQFCITFNQTSRKDAPGDQMSAIAVERWQVYGPFQLRCPVPIWMYLTIYFLCSWCIVLEVWPVLQAEEIFAHK